MRRSRHFAGAVLALGAWALLSAPRTLTSDGLQRYEDLKKLWSGGGVGGGRYSLVGPFFASPLLGLDAVLSRPGTTAVYFNVLVFFLGLGLLWRWLRPALGVDGILAFTLLLIFGSMFPFHTLGFYGEVFTAVGLGVGIAAVVFGRQKTGILLLTLGAANTPAALVPLGAMLALRAWRLKSPRPLILALLPLCLILTENWLRRGSPLATGYEGTHGIRTDLVYSDVVGFGFPLWIGVLSLLFSFGKGLLFFAPGAFVPAFARPPFRDQRLEELFWLWLVGLAGFILVYAKWWQWNGDEYWGPRYLLFAGFPAALALVEACAFTSWRARAAVGLALVLSLWVGFDGLVFGQHDMSVCYGNGAQLAYLCWYTPDFSALIRPFMSPRALQGREILLAVVWWAAAGVLLRPLASFRPTARNGAALPSE